MLKTAPPPFTFAAAEARTKTISDPFILDGLNDVLAIPDGTPQGERVWDLKMYLDRVPADASDVAFAANERAVIGYRDELSDFIARHNDVHISGPNAASLMPLVRAARRAFSWKLQNDKRLVADWIHGVRAGARPRTPLHAWEFHGFNIVHNGRTVDLTAERFPGVRPAIQVQRNHIRQFVVWSSADYLGAAAKGNKPRLTHRIYLNPTIASSIGIFEQVITAAEQQGLAIKGKILDRSGELVAGVPRHGSGGMNAQRGDGIVLLVSKRESDILLGIVERVHRANYPAFRGRKTSRIPIAIADGVAVGSESRDPEVESLTKNRANVLFKVLEQTRQLLGLAPGERVRQRDRAISTFRKLWPRIAARAGIDPDNIAFSKR